MDRICGRSRRIFLIGSLIKHILNFQLIDGNSAGSTYPLIRRGFLLYFPADIYSADSEGGRASGNRNNRTKTGITLGRPAFESSVPESANHEQPQQITLHYCSDLDGDVHCRMQSHGAGRSTPSIRIGDESFTGTIPSRRSDIG